MRELVPYSVPRSKVAHWVAALALLPLLAGVGLWGWWRATGAFGPLTAFFHLVNPVALVGLAACQLWLAMRAWREFSPSQPMWAVWGGLTCAAAAQLAGAVIAQILSVRTPLNPWPALAGNAFVRGLGVTCAGPVHLSLLLLSFALAITVHRSFGWSGRLRWYDWPVILIVAGLTGRQTRDLLVLYPEQMTGPARLVQWLTDPLLLVLLILVAFLWRAAGSRQGGLAGLCWGFYGLGILLTALGDFSLWTVWSGHLKVEDASLVSWFVWLPAYGAFALGPACQVEAVELARGSGIEEGLRGTT